MTAYLLTNHLLNFMAPAALVALLFTLTAAVSARIFKSKRPVVPVGWVQFAILFIVNMAILAVGLVLFGNDAKMATYAAMVVGAGFCRWLLVRGWR
jgi:hypothetical protein